MNETPRPWHVGPHYKCDIESRYGHVGACGPMNSPLGIANAALIVRAVNAHDDLLTACRAFVEAWEKSHQLEKTDVALRLAKAAIARVES